MLYQIPFVLLTILIFAWMYICYGTEERAERFNKLTEQNMILRAVDTGILLGLPVVGITFIVLNIV